MVTSRVVGPGEFFNSVDPRYREIRKLASLLRWHCVPHVLKVLSSYRGGIAGGQILYFGDADPLAPNAMPIASIIETSYSNSAEQDLLEMMGLLTPEEQRMDDILENLTAQQCFERIWEHWMQEV